MNEKLIPGTVVKITAGVHKGKAGRIAGEVSPDNLYPVIIDGKVRKVRADHVEVMYG